MMPLSEALLKADDFVVEDFFVLKLKVLGVSRLERPTDVRLNDARIVVVIIAIYFRILTRDGPVIDVVIGEKIGEKIVVITFYPRSLRYPDILGGKSRRVDICGGYRHTVKVCRGRIRI